MFCARTEREIESLRAALEAALAAIEAPGRVNRAALIRSIRAALKRHPRWKGECRG